MVSDSNLLHGHRAVHRLRFAFKCTSPPAMLGTFQTVMVIGDSAGKHAPVLGRDPLKPGGEECNACWPAVRVSLLM